MPLRPVPWATGNGAENSVELARAVAQVGSSGATGIVEPADFKVVQTPTPGAAVRVRKGTGVVLSTYPGVFGQSYVVQEQSYTDVPVAATGSSSGVTKYVYVVIQDHQYAGPAPESVEGGPYNFYEVSATLPQFQPYLLLAKIVQPASTATITNGMIEDVREVANPKQITVPRARPLNSIDTETLSRSTPEGEWFPNAGAHQNIFIPDWATRLIIEAEWIMVNERGGNAYGGCWVEWGPYVSPGIRRESTQHYRWNTHSGPDAARGTWKVVDYQYIPPDIRGTEQAFAMKAWVDWASSNAARPQLDQHSGVLLKVTFMQMPDPSTS